MIKELCQQYTFLKEDDITKLQAISQQMQLMADLNRADIFIDCMSREKDVAMVVAEAKPFLYKSHYKDSVVGQYAYRHNEPAVLRTLELGMPTRDLRAITQEEQMVRQNVVPIKNDDGVTIACLIMETDVYESEQKHAKIQMLTQTTENLSETLRTIHEEVLLNPYLNDGIIIFDANGISQSVNPMATKLYRKLGYLDVLQGIPFENLVLDGNSFKIIANNPNFKISEVTVGDMSLQIKYVNLNSAQYEMEGVLMVIKDITDKKAIEKALITKSVAIREIHHRVKNNLQTIASLLRLQLRRVDNKESKKAFEESINRVSSIAVTHEILAQNGVDEVDIKTILKRIVDNADNVSFNECQVELIITGDTFYITSELATSIGLVVNELVQNSLQYAFVGREKGQIIVQIEKGIQYSSILVQDDGVGFDVKNSRKGSLGISIVQSIVEDTLKGCFSLESASQGTKANFDFRMKTESI
ncbi:two-component sensor histidine kinase [Natranaerovirga hydrolytica]|uniref:histidine kinase n=1 Tax=Natranaerovirga hydrolytica TaxID=680378 RepID=A0A4R1N7Z9_9FIRM|nr:histidine kinase N-terminal domain-containing protein [Natranaerovirga hydrolytica]TCK98803.1 two-component sensor histidine kinase [Natranaerovirga hydrolytica]